MAEAEPKGGCDVCMMNCTKEENLLGLKKYNYGYLCKPQLLPWCKKEGAPAPRFFGKDEKLPLLLSLVLGFQHCLAMLAGIATSGGYLISNDTCFDFQNDTQMCGRMPWLISTAWLTSGILTAIQVFRARIKGTPYYLGTGLISVMGTSFTFLPIARSMVLEAIAEAKPNSNGSPTSTSWAVCATDAVTGAPIYDEGCCHKIGFQWNCYGAGSVGYGRFLGTCLVASLVEVGVSFIPPKILKKLFPPVVTGAAIMLIGGGLIGAGIKYVGGGVFCAENTESKAPVHGFIGQPQLCFNDNGEVAMSFGSAEYVGLAFSVICMSVLLQIFGSPFLKSTFLLWALAFGCICATAGKEVTVGGTTTTLSFFRKDFLERGKAVTFLWAPPDGESLPTLGFSGTYFPLVLIGFLVSTLETIGDVEMTCIYSKVDEPADRASRIQGGLLADGFNSFLACLFGSPPNTTFSQNNGLISLTRCASRSAGFSCAFWLCVLGIFGKFGALFASIPICVVGGLVLQCFASVFISGMKVATMDFTRRNQFILMLALGIGLGVAMEEHIFDWPGPYSFYRKNLAYDYGFWPEKMVCDTPNGGWINSNGFDISRKNVFSAAYSTHSVAADGLCHGVGFFANGVNNGNCCSVYNKSAAAGRKTLLLILKTPYGIGAIIAFVLNLILPEDAPDADSDSPKVAAGETASA